MKLIKKIVLSLTSLALIGIMSVGFAKVAVVTPAQPLQITGTYSIINPPSPIHLMAYNGAQITAEGGKFTLYNVYPGVTYWVFFANSDGIQGGGQCLWNVTLTQNPNGSGYQLKSKLAWTPNAGITCAQTSSDPNSPHYSVSYISA